MHYPILSFTRRYFLPFLFLYPFTGLSTRLGVYIYIYITQVASLAFHGLVVDYSNHHLFYGVNSEGVH